MKENYQPRPFVIFDPSVKEHRKDLLKFIQTNSWKHSPYRYRAPMNITGNDLGIMQRKLLEYYAENGVESV